MSLLRSPLGVVGGIMVALLVGAAVSAPLVAPYAPTALASESLQPPSTDHLLGTNNLGHDNFSRLVWGARTSLSVAAGAAALTVALAVAVGVGAGLRGGLVDLAAMRVVDVFLALPTLPLLIFVAALMTLTRPALIVAIGVLTWPTLARILRSQTLSLRQRGFVTAAGGFGGGAGYIVRRHLVPALGPILVAGFVTVAGRVVLLETGLAFLGLADPTGVSWGFVLNRALDHPGLYFSPAWTWWVLPTGFAISALAIGLMLLGVALEPILNRRAGSPA
jgi:peptide/nickel transport system permease protein